MLETNTNFKGVVLVVDDNPLITNVLNHLLTQQQCTVITAAHGKEALDALKTHDVDLILCDVMMPEMDGYALHRAVREIPELAHLPFVFLSALGEPSEVLTGKAEGADDYLVKPFNPKELCAVVQGKLRRAREQKAANTERYDAYRKRVVHVLSHEFRTPLVAINTGTELLLERQEMLDRAKVKNLLEAIQRGGQRLERLVSDFMLIQQVEAGLAQRTVAARATVSLMDRLVIGYVERNREGLEQDGFKVSLVQRAEHLMVKMYEPFILDVLERVVSNVRKFHGTTRVIDFVISERDGFAVVEICDRGPGIDPVRLSEALDLFGQIDREKLEQQGGGLGLAIASRYCAIHGGKIEFKLREGGGTSVGILLPQIK